MPMGPVLSITACPVSPVTQVGGGPTPVVGEVEGLGPPGACGVLVRTGYILPQWTRRWLRGGSCRGSGVREGWGLSSPGRHVEVGGPSKDRCKEDGTGVGVLHVWTSTLRPVSGVDSARDCRATSPVWVEPSPGVVCVVDPHPGRVTSRTRGVRYRGP